ncbi:hypothetical protein ACLBWT_12520 [Paenibacillus sp. D51F]
MVVNLDRSSRFGGGRGFEKKDFKNLKKTLALAYVAVIYYLSRR